MDDTEAHINFDAPAVLRKWPSLANLRTEDAAPYLLVEGHPLRVSPRIHDQATTRATYTKYTPRPSHR